jgi:uncharacterized repeat protein (TIGR03803 family)
MNIQKHRYQLLSVLAAASLLSSLQARAEQTLETLVSFSGQNGSNPESIVQGPHGNFYGTTYSGGTGGKGTLFEVPLNSPIRTLVNFDGANGSNPESRLVEWTDGNLYGTTYSGGAHDDGTIFQLTPAGHFRTVVSFNGANGSAPISGLILGSDGGLYGTTSTGGAYGKGTLFEITRSGGPAAAMTSIHSRGFASGGMPSNYDPKDMAGLAGHNPVYGNIPNDPANLGDPADPADPADPGLNHLGTAVMTTIVSFSGANGANPQGLIRGANGDFYGTTSGGGMNNDGTIFELSPAGKITTLLDFNGANGANPHARLGQLADGNFYGTTYNGGANNLGTVFTFTPDGKLTTLVSFDGANGSHPDSALVPWSNGFFYLESLYENIHIKTSQIQWSGVNFCGTTSTGGAHDNGTIFQVTDSGALLTLVSFSGTNGEQLGTIPDSIVPGNDGNLYGTTYYGGASNHGTMFRLTLLPFPPPTVPPSTATAQANVVPANTTF